VCVCVCVCGAGSFINCRDILNCFGSYSVTVSVCILSVLSERMCVNLIIPGKLSHVHFGTYVLGLIGTCSVFGIETCCTVRLDFAIETLLCEVFVCFFLFIHKIFNILWK
jgi:hypothetical protein